MEGLGSYRESRTIIVVSVPASTVRLFAQLMGLLGVRAPRYKPQCAATLIL